MGSMNTEPKPGTPESLPWWFDEEAGAEAIRTDSDTAICFLEDETGEDWSKAEHKAHAAYIVHACNEFPSLSARLEGLEMERDRLREALNGLVLAIEMGGEKLLPKVMSARLSSARAALNEANAGNPGNEKAKS